MVRAYSSLWGLGSRVQGLGYVSLAEDSKTPGFQVELGSLELFRLFLAEILGVTAHLIHRSLQERKDTNKLKIPKYKMQTPWLWVR